MSRRRATPPPVLATPGDRPRGGQALKVAIHTARPAAGITSDMQLSVQAGVSYDTLMNWYGDKTVPRPAEVKKVAEALGVPYGDLLAVYEGRDPTPMPIQDAILELVAALREQTAMRELVAAMREATVESRLARAELHQVAIALVVAITTGEGGELDALVSGATTATRDR